MIFVAHEEQAGKKDLAGPLQRMGLPVEVTRMPFGDVAFMGRGEKGADLYIGMELKKVGELATSLVTKRFQGHQLLGLTRDFDRRYLIIEGDYHHDDRGRAVVYRGKGKAQPLAGAANAVAFEQELINIQTRGGVWERHTTTRRDTLRVIQAAYRYWTDKDLDEHKSHMAMYAPDLDKGLLTPASDFRKAMAVLLPGMHIAVSKALETYIGEALPLRQQLLRVCGMREDEWSGLLIPDRHGKTRRFGESRAKEVLATLSR